MRHFPTGKQHRPATTRTFVDKDYRRTNKKQNGPEPSSTRYTSTIAPYGGSAAIGFPSQVSSIATFIPRVASSSSAGVAKFDTTPVSLCIIFKTKDTRSGNHKPTPACHLVRGEIFSHSHHTLLFGWIRGQPPGVYVRGPQRTWRSRRGSYKIEVRAALSFTTSQAKERSFVEKLRVRYETCPNFARRVSRL